MNMTLQEAEDDYCEFLSAQLPNGLDDVVYLYEYHLDKYTQGLQHFLDTQSEAGVNITHPEIVN